jgi:hypothetical protein
MLAALLFLAAAGFGGSDRAALNLAIAGTRKAPPDLSTLIVQFRKEYLTGVRGAARRPPPADFAGEARAISRAILARAPFREAIGRIGALIGGVLAAEAPAADAGFEKASAGPYRIPGVDAASAAGDPSPASRSILAARAELAAAGAGPEAAASRIVSDETRLLWAIWTGAGGDARPAKELNERNGPYDVPGAPR